VVGDQTRTTARRGVGSGLLGVGLLFTLVAWRLHGFDVAYGSEGMHIALAAIVATIGLVIAGLACLHFLRTALLADLAFAVGFGIVAGENIFALALPTLLNHEVLVPSAVWTAVALELVAAFFFLLGSVAGSRRLKASQGVIIAALTAGLVATVATSMVALGTSLSLPIDPALSPTGAQRHAFEGAAVVLVIHGLCAVLLLVAGTVALVQERGGDRLLAGWLAPALLVASAAALNYALFPSLYSYWVYSGDLLRLSFCLVLAWGITVELRALLRRAIDLAVLEERRRLARDLHDGVAQELAFIATEVGEIPDDLHPSLRWIRSAAERGLYESRRAIAALTLPLDRPFAELFAASIEEITNRGDVALSLEIGRSVDLPQPMQETVVRVAREAVLNAAQHARPSHIRVGLHSNGDLRLDVADDGQGFDVQQATTGFGLTSIRERIELSGGQFHVRSSPGDGTRLTATWSSLSPPNRNSSRSQAGVSARSLRESGREGE
jgi:signal transduction histidine kinase